MKREDIIEQLEYTSIDADLLQDFLDEPTKENLNKIKLSLMNEKLSIIDALYVIDQYLKDPSNK